MNSSHNHTPALTCIRNNNKNNCCREEVQQQQVIITAVYQSANDIESFVACYLLQVNLIQEQQKVGVSSNCNNKKEKNLPNK